MYFPLQQRKSAFLLASRLAIKGQITLQIEFRTCQLAFLKASRAQLDRGVGVQVVSTYYNARSGDPRYTTPALLDQLGSLAVSKKNCLTVQAIFENLAETHKAPQCSSHKLILASVARQKIITWFI